MPLSTPLRKQLEKTVVAARDAAESGAHRALEALGVALRDAPAGLTEESKHLRRRLRAHARQLGDALDPQERTQETRRLAKEIAYAHWHRLLFARFLAENQLLLEPESGAPVTPQDLIELAREEHVEPAALAADYARPMLPRIFRAGDPALAVSLPPETRQHLTRVLGQLPPEVFTADDSLGWVYQFWQAKEKKAVNERVKSGEKITGETLPAVTQLFTEHYMVRFLIDNSIGAWWAGKKFAEDPSLAQLPADMAPADREPELRKRLTVRGSGGQEQTWDYLRFVEDERSVPGTLRVPRVGAADAPDPKNARAAPDNGTRSVPATFRPAAGTFPQWPADAAGIFALDPCCGSGHFLTALLDTLAALRAEEENLSEEAALKAVLADNLFGLELDPRCTQIAAFAVALTAWKRIGRPVPLPRLRIACSGIGPSASREEWLKLANQTFADRGTPKHEQSAIRGGLSNLYDLFEQAPELGSLLDPTRVEASLGSADWQTLQPFLSSALRAEGDGEDAEARERAVAAAGMAEAAEILAGPDGEGGGYTVVMTNVPYLGRSGQSPSFRAFAEKEYQDSKADLATMFIQRSLQLTHGGGTAASVSPQNWMFLTSYRKLRRVLLAQHSWNSVARLGAGAFSSIGGEVVNVVLMTASSNPAQPQRSFFGIDVSEALDCGSEDELPQAASLRSSEDVLVLTQKDQLNNPDARVTLEPPNEIPLLQEVADYSRGICTGDDLRFVRSFFELDRIGADWAYQQSTVEQSTEYGGNTRVLFWEDGAGELREAVVARLGEDLVGSWLRGKQVWDRPGLVVSPTGNIRTALYLGGLFDANTLVVVAKSPEHLSAFQVFGASDLYHDEVRKVDQALKVGDALVKVPFDLPHWQAVAAEKYPEGLPEPFSHDPTQWLFHGHPAHAEPGTELHVALARLLGYRWPAELDPEMRLSKEQRALTTAASSLPGADDDGIVCLTPVAGEAPADERLREILRHAYADRWAADTETALIRASFGDKPPRKLPTLAAWLRDSAFEQHVKLFKSRPFLWHVWDGKRDGFHAWVNYHALAGSDAPPVGQACLPAIGSEGSKRRDPDTPLGKETTLPASGRHGRLASLPYGTPEHAAGHPGKRTLNKLTHTYLNDWIDRQRKAGNAEGAPGRLEAAVSLQQSLEKILEGEAPFDLFIRWKPLSEQPLGWEPDLNDGVRLNLRPFLSCPDVGKKGAGILRAKPGTVSYKVDRGKEPESLRPRAQFPWFWSCPAKRDGTASPTDFPGGDTFDGVRHNNLHHTLAAKAAAREAQAARKA